jgi:hypothetical protein
MCIMRGNASDTYIPQAVPYTAAKAPRGADKYATRFQFLAVEAVPDRLISIAGKGDGDGDDDGRVKLTYDDGDSTGDSFDQCYGGFEK